MSCRNRPRKQSRPSRFPPIPINGPDLTSQLPEALLQHILFCLPLEDAITASSLSKAWLGAWKSLPVLSFRFNQHVANAEGEQAMGLEELAKKVDDSLETLKTQRAFIKSFFLHIDLNPTEGGNFDINQVSDRFHDWVDLIVKNYVTEIKIRVSNSHLFYTLPLALFLSRSLVKLHLEGCRFHPYTFCNAEDYMKVKFTFNSLKELTIVNVVCTQNQVQTLVNLSRALLEKLVIKRCSLVEFLILNAFSKLSYVEVHVRMININSAPKLEALIMHGLWRVLCYNCPNITNLTCYSWEHHNGLVSIQDLVLNLPLLETLKLFLKRTERIKVRSAHLRNLFLSEGPISEEPLEVELRTPNLRNVFFNGACVPFVRFFLDRNEVLSNANQEVEMHHFGNSSHGVRLHQIGKFSRNRSHPVVQIYLHKISSQDALTLEELKVDYPVRYYASNVKTLVIDHIPESSSNYANFLENLFWSCHPKTLKLVLSEQALSSPYKNAFLMYICWQLLDKPIELTPQILTCCTASEEMPSKCWRHFISHVKCYIHRGVHETDDADLTNRIEELGMIFVRDDNVDGVIMEFRLKWRLFPKFY